METHKRYVRDDQAAVLNPLGEEKVEDRIRNNKSGVSVMLGVEYRKGERRVQGVFGAGVLFSFMNNKRFTSAPKEIFGTTNHSTPALPVIPV